MKQCIVMLQSDKLLLNFLNIYKIILHIIVSWGTQNSFMIPNLGRDA